MSQNVEAIDDGQLQTIPGPGASETPNRSFTFPSAYTILFALIVLTAAATWIIPAGTYEYNQDGEPIPGPMLSVYPRSTEEFCSTRLRLSDQRHVRRPG